ncbi:uncharacterized protein EMH_0047440 [Eimeria mitis]|uniref:SAG family member n=1 Tax=Eimeria mitis TaxID=44415 RepID=U6JWK9_9EIME|nr:uncharacterized protein EMH_0047440 [Eimeria mitis]CDJ29171.1 hypothetical protein EMH_0047440 [Eimeria mitis]
MAPFYKTAAAFCLVGLFGLQSEAAETPKYKFVVVDVKDDAYLTVRLARNGKLSVKTNEVAKDADILSALQAKVQEAEQDTQATCATVIESKFKKIFHHSFEFTEDPDYRELVQDALTTGLKAIG